MGNRNSKRLQLLCGRESIMACACTCFTSQNARSISEIYSGCTEACQEWITFTHIINVIYKPISFSHSLSVHHSTITELNVHLCLVATHEFKQANVVFSRCLESSVQKRLQRFSCSKHGRFPSASWSVIIGFANICRRGQLVSVSIWNCVDSPGLTVILFCFEPRWEKKCRIIVCYRFKNRY